MTDPSSFSLRVKSRAGQHVLRDLNLSSTSEQLKNVLSLMTGIPNRSLRVLCGFPPRVKELRDADQTLQQLGFRSGDTLIVEQLSMKDNLKRYFNNGTMRAPMCNARGVFMKKVVPADNSCLFTSVYFLVSGGTLDLTCAPAMRQLIVDAVKADKTNYTEAFLGRSNSSYRSWIGKGDSWGGAIELSILSNHFGLELCVVDAQTGHMGCFGEDRNYQLRGFLLYSGIHYDPLFWESHSDAVTSSSSSGGGATSGGDSVQTLFSSRDAIAEQMALEIGIAAKNAREFTNVDKFNLRCLVCQAGLVGQHGAMQHAKETGHSNFGEIS